MWNKLLLFPVCLLTTLGVMADYPPMDIQTRDGQTFKNAVVEGVNPGGIDIGYVNADGYYVLKGLSFKNLPEDLQERFGYDPQEEQEQAEKETNEMLTAEDAVETTMYLANAPDCCSGEEKLGNVLGMLGANVADEDIYHGEDQHPKMSM